MGLFNWLMKGMGDEEENDAEPKESKKERKRRKKEERLDNKNSHGQESEQMRMGNSFSSDPDQFNTATHFDTGNVYQQNMGGYGTKNVVFFYPKNYADIQNLVDFLKQGESAILNLDGINDDEAQRMLDFVSGAVYALNGSTQRIDGNIFLLTPEGLNIMVPNENPK